MPGAIPPLPYMPSWCGTQLKAQGQLYLYFYLSSVVNSSYALCFTVNVKEY